MLGNINTLLRTARSAILSIFSPDLIANLIFWTKSEILPKDQWNTPDHQLNNEVGLPDLQLKTGSGINLVAATSDQVVFENIGNIKSIEFWIKLTSTTEKIIGLNATASIEVIGGTITINSWSGATIKVNDVAGSTLDTNFKHVLISSSTAISASDFKIGNVNGVFGSFTIKDLIVYTVEKNTSNYNTPQSITSAADAVLIIPFSETKFFNNLPALNIVENGIIGTFLTSATVGYDAAINDSEFGLQKGLHSYNEYLNFNGTDNYVILPEVGNNQNIKFKLRFLGGNNTGRLFTNRTDEGGYDLAFDSFGRLALFIGNQNFIVTPIINPDSIIHEIILEANISSFTLKYDGLEVLNEKITFAISSNNNLTLGSNLVNGQLFRGLIINLEFYDNGILTNSYLGTDFVDKTGNKNGIYHGTVNKTAFLSNTAIALTDILNNPIATPWKSGRINCLGGKHGGTTALNLGNVRTLAFGLFIETAATNQTIFETGTGNDIMITSSAIASTDFSIITVDGGANAITDATWHYIELQNVTNVTLSAFRLKEGFDGIIIPFIAYPQQITSAQSAGLKGFF